jgi:RNA polymerase sigma factor (sigma-70 family)
MEGRYMNTINERDLINLVRQGGPGAKDAIAQLYELYQPYMEEEAKQCLYNYEDLAEFCQEVWKRALEKLPFLAGDSLKPLLGKAYLGDDKPEGIIGRYYLDFIRKECSELGYYSELYHRKKAKKRKKKTLSLDAQVGEDQEGNPLFLKNLVPDNSQTPLEILLEKETRQIVVETIERLPRIYRYVILMRYFDGRTVKDIARLLNIAEEQVYLRLSRAYTQLKGLLIKRLGPNPLEEINIFRSREITRRK